MFIDAITEDAATGDVEEYYRQQRAAWGFLPNYAGTFSTRPDVAQAWNSLNAAIRTGMDRRRFELATIAAARALHSTYCTAAHSKFLREVCGDEKTLDLIAQDPTGAALTPADRAVYRFAAKVATSAESVCQQDVDELRELGLDDVDIADLVFAAAARSFFTRVLDGLAAQLDAETARTFPPLSWNRCSSDAHPPTAETVRVRLRTRTSGSRPATQAQLHPAWLRNARVGSRGTTGRTPRSFR